MACVHNRKEILLTSYREKRSNIDTLHSARTKKEEELNGLRTETERRIVEEEIREVLKQLMAEVRASQPDYIMVFSGNHGNLLEVINNLGVVYQKEVPILIKPIVATAIRGSAPGELNNPCGVAIDDNTNRVYVIETRESCRISVFSETGEFVNAIQNPHMTQPHGVAVHGDNLYVTDVVAHGVFQFKLNPEIHLVCSLGNMGPENGHFNTPLGLTVSSVGEVLIADFNNNRVEILEATLHYKRTIADQSMYRPMDVNLTHEEVFVLCNANPCMYVFSIEGEKIREIITCGLGMDVINCNFFCLDIKGNIVDSDGGIDQVKTFSKEGTRVRTTGGRGDQLGQFLDTTGIAMSKSNKLAVVSYNPNFVLQIFSIK